jgi:hypothetical protein
MKLTKEHIRSLIREAIGEQEQQGGESAKADPTTMEKEGRSAVALVQQQLRKVPERVRSEILTVAQKSPQNQRAVMSVVLQVFAGLTAEQINTLYKQGAKVVTDA